jgi:hypothetical protein
MEDTARDIQQPLDQYVSDLDDAVSYQAPPRVQAPPVVDTSTSDVETPPTANEPSPSNEIDSPEAPKQ